MIDIFSEEFQLQRLALAAKMAAERTKNATPEENLRYLIDLGICDENGNITPEYR